MNNLTQSNIVKNVAGITINILECECINSITINITILRYYYKYIRMWIEESNRKQLEQLGITINILECEFI